MNVVVTFADGTRLTYDLAYTQHETPAGLFEALHAQAAAATDAELAELAITRPAITPVAVRLGDGWEQARGFINRYQETSPECPWA